MQRLVLQDVVQEPDEFAMLLLEVQLDKVRGALTHRVHAIHHHLSRAVAELELRLRELLLLRINLARLWPHEGSNPQ